MSVNKRGEAGQKKHVRPGLKPKALVLAVAACFGMSAQANPTAPVVVHGSASFATAGNILNVTNSANAIINWGSFSIGANELTRFIQPSALSAVLNRVTGQDPSAILGALQSNGRVFLVNPNGIMFGAGAQIDVAGLVASTLNLSNDDFLNNRMRFTDGAGAGNVLNQGNITGGNVYLIGKAVTNDGLINTPNGEVLLAAGNSVELVNPGTPNLRVEIVAPDNEARNLGSIAAEAGRVGIYAGLIQQGGLINANSAVAEGGRILLKAAKNTTLDAGSQTTASGASGGSVTIQSGDTTLAAGSIEARGGSGAGGTVQVLGNKVGLTGNAVIDASGETGGGTVLVGGDFQGKNPEVQNAFRSYVGEDVSIRADAVTQGDGGKVIVWADDTTRYYGNISARGGAVAGNGGFAEVSGKHNLDFRGTADLSAPMGQVGTLLLDPDFISIDISGLDPLPVIGLGPELGYLFADPGAYGGPSISIDPMLINAAAANVILQANENIDVNAPVSMINSGVGITMQAGGYVNVNANIITRGGQIELVAGDPGTLGSPSEGAVIINAVLDTTNATPAGADVLISSFIADVGGNSISFGAGGGIIAGTGGAVDLSTNSVRISQNAAASISAASLSATADAQVSLGGSNSVNNVNLASTGGGAITYRNALANYNIAGVSTTNGATFSNVTVGAANITGALSVGVGQTLAIPTIEQSGTGSISGGAGAVLSTTTYDQSGGTLNINIPTANIGTLTLNPGSTLGGTGTLNVSTLLWSGGTITGAGPLVTGIGSTTTIGASPLLNAKTWNNSGTVTIAGTDRLTLTSGATLNNSGTIDLNGTNSNPIFYIVGGNTLNNSGILNKNAAGTQVLDIGGAINNTFAFNISAGQLDLNNGGTHTGDFEVLSGATLNFGSGTHNFNPGITFEGAGTMQIAGATVNVNTPLTLGLTEPAVVMTSGDLVKNSNLTLNGSFDWSGGTISGAGLLTTGAGSTTAIGASPLLSNTTWHNHGTITIAGTDRLTLGNSTMINQAGGVIDLTGTNSNPVFFTSASTFTNAGTLNKTSAGTQTLDVNSTISNTGLLHVAAGQLNLDDDGTHTGSFDIDPGAILRFASGSHQLNAGSAFTDTGTLEITGGTFNINTPLTFGAGQPVVALSGGSVVGNSNLTLNGTFNWSGGVISGAGQLITGATATTTIGAAPELNGKSWFNSGIVNVGGTGRLLVYGGSTLDNLAGGLIDLSGTNSNPIFHAGGINTLNNAGTLAKTSAGIQALEIGGTISNTGLLHVAAGQLNLDNNGTHTGTFDIDPGAILRFSANSHQLNAGSAFTDTGTLQITGATTFNVNTPLTFGAGQPAVEVIGGNVAGNSDLTLNGIFDWSGGTISGPALLITGPSATTTITGFPTLTSKTWQNSGVVTIGGTGRLTLSAGAILDNLAGAVIDLAGTNSNPIFSSVGGNIINNAGALDKNSAGTQFLDISGTINNTGVMHVNAGQLDLNNDGTHSGTFDINSGATLRFSTGTHDLNAGTTFSDLGVLHVAGAIVNVNTPLTIGAGQPAVAVLSGTVTGSSDLTLNGLFDWSGGTISGPGLLVTGPTATTTITGSPTLNAKTWQNNGTVTIGGTGRLSLSGGAILDNLAGGLVEFTGSNSNPIFFSSGGNIINNAGSLDKTSAGTQVLDINGTINNTGVLYVIAGQLDLNNGGTHGGTFGIDPSATLRFASGTHNLNAGTAFTDTGALQFAGTTVNVNTPLTFGAAQPSVAVLNGTVTGGSNLTLNGTFDWSGGTISGPGLLITGPSATTTIGASPLLSGKNWQNSGTVTIGGTSRLTLSGGAILDNLAGGLIDLAGTNSNPIFFSAAGNTFNNAGTLNKTTGGTQSLDINGTISNTGLIDVQSGTLQVADFPTNAGTIRTAAGSVFQTTGNLTNTGTLEGTGTFDVGPANTLTNDGTLRPGTSPGLLTVTGNLALGATSIIDAEINGTVRGTQYDAIDVSGDAVLGGVLNVTYNAFTPGGGQQFSLIQAAGTVTGGFATINDPNALTPQITLGPPGFFKLGLFGGALSWDGGASTLNWLDALNWSGDFVPTNTNDVVIGTGFGAIVVNGAAEAKSIVADSPLLLSTGSLTLTNPSQFNELFTLAGGSLSGTGSVTVGGSAGALAWTGGAMGAGGNFTLGSGRSGSLSGALTLDRLFVNNGILGVSSATVGGAGSLVNAGTVNFLAGIVNLNLPYMATGQSTINGATVNLNGGSPTALANVTMSTGALQSADNIAVSGTFDWSGGSVGGAGQLITSSTAITNITGSVGLAPGKTWGNDGMVNLTGASTVDLGDSTPAIFNNNAGGAVNIDSTAGWSFISDPSSQAGQINNAGMINVNNSTSWEAAYNNFASGTLNIAAGKSVSMQNGQNISGTVNIGAGSTLWVSERHGVDAMFSNLGIGGSGTLQVLGSGPVAKFTNVGAPGVTLRLGSGGQVGIVNGSALFGSLLLDSLALGTNFSMSDGQFVQAAGNLIVPPGAVHGGLNNVYVAQAGDLMVPGLVDGGSGSLTLVAPAGSVLVNGGTVFAPVVNLFGGNVSVGDSAASSPSEVYAMSVLTVHTDGSLKVLGGSGAGASALLSSSGALSVTTGADVDVAGGSGTNAWAKISGNPDVVLASVGGVVRVDAGSGSGAFGLIEAVAIPTIHAHFPNLASGGYFVNGVEGAVYDAATGSGFMSGGLPAELGSTFVVTYGLTGGLFEEIINAPTQALVAATIESTEPPAEQEQQQATEDEKKKEEKDKKDTPVCK